MFDLLLWRPNECLAWGWWNGTSIWRSLTIRPFNILPIHWVGSLGFLLSTTGIALCLIEVTYPFLIWWQPLRKAVLFAICAIHLGIAMVMGMVLCGAIMIILNLAAVWPCEEGIEAGVASANQRLPQNMAQASAAEKIAGEGI